MAEVANNKDLDETEQMAELQRISDEYYALHQNLTDQLKVAMEATDDIYGQYSDVYTEITGDLMAKQADYAKSFGETILGQMSGYDTLEKRTAAWEESFKQYHDSIIESVHNYYTEVDTTNSQVDKSTT